MPNFKALAGPLVAQPHLSQPSNEFFTQSVQPYRNAWTHDTTMNIAALIDRYNFQVPSGRWQLFEFCDLEMYVPRCNLQSCATSY